MNAEKSREMLYNVKSNTFDVSALKQTLGGPLLGAPKSNYNT